MADEADVWQAIRQADLPNDRRYEVLPTPPGPWSAHLSIDVYVPGGPSRTYRVAETDTVDRLVVLIRYLAEVVLDAERYEHSLIYWRETGDPRWELWRTASHIDALRQRDVEWETIEQQLGLDASERALWQMRIGQNPALVCAADRLRRQEERDNRSLGESAPQRPYRGNESGLDE